jgi:hypothetical protein
MNGRQESARHGTISVERRPALPSADADANLLTPQQLAERLAVPQSWVREKTRQRARVRDRDPLPVVRLGKYVRFSWPAVEKWLARQGV